MMRKTTRRRDAEGERPTTMAVSAATPFSALRLTRPQSGAEDADLLRLAETAGNMGHWYADLVTGTVTWSPQVYRIFGVEPAAFTPDLHAIAQACNPDDRAQIEAKLQAATAGKAGFEFDCRITRPDGARRTIISTGQPEIDSTGRTIALFGVVTDVTEAFDTIRAIQDQNEMLDLAAELAHLGHWVWSRDDDGLSFCSEEMGRIHDLTAGSFLRQFTRPDLLAAVVTPEYRERYRATVTDALAEARGYEMEYRIETCSGILKDIREIGQPIFDSENRLSRFIATAQDITEEKARENELREAKLGFERQTEALRRSEEALKQKTQELQQLNLEKDKLFSIIAHDLRNPFNSIIGFADLLVTKARDLSHGQTVSYAQIVRESATGVHNLLDNLLVWASFHIRDGALKLEPLNMAAVTAASIEPLAYMAEGKGVTVANNVGDVTVLGDEPLVRVVLRNLVSNGIKFSRQGGVVQITAASVADPETHAGAVRITVRDDGIGMSANALANLFALDRTVSVPGTRGEKGTGLGLYLCRDIIKRHGGHVTVDSAPGGGTAFHVTLPAVP